MQKIFIKLICIIMAVAMLIGVLASCGKKTPTETTGSTGTTGNIERPAYQDDGKTYSYRMGPSDLPESWNYHTYQSDSSTYILDYTSDGLYTFEYNDDFSGYVIVPSMAVDYPEDVTSKYVGQYGVKEGDENKVYKITLRQNLKFDNGEAITAKSFVDSMKLLLNPAAANFRADNVYQSGNLKIVGAEAYVKGGSYALGEFVSANMGDDEYVNPSDFTTADDGTLKYEGQDIVLDIKSGGNWGSNGLSDYYNAYKDAMPAFAAGVEPLIKAADSNGRVKLTPALLKNLQDAIAILHGFENVEAYAAEGGDYAYMEFEEMAFFGKTWDVIDYEGNVGFFAPSDYELVIVLKNPMEDNFYLRYELCSSFFLVYTPLYESCIKTDGGVYANTYATSVDTFVGYGPYKLTSYVEGAQIVLERNPHWHGYAEGEYIPGTYQTDRIVYNKVAEDATRLEMFLKGELDSYGLLAEDMNDYLGSDYTYFTDSESTWYLAMNPGLDNLKSVEAAASPVVSGNKVIKTVLTIEEFRQALSYSIDRSAFNAQLSPTSGVAKALLSAFIVADPESGLTYRATDAGKDAILAFWGLSDAWGEGKEYATRDDAIASITGYDPSGAKTLFNTAYDKAVEAGLITAEDVASGKWEVQIVIGKPTESNFWNRGYEFLRTCWTNAAAGTKFEGHLTFVQSQVLGATTFGDYLKNGQVDVLFGVGYGGSQFNPYSMMDCFTGSLQYDPFTDKTKVMLDIELDGKTLRASLYDWVSEALQGNTITTSVVGADGNTTGETVSISAGPSDPAERRVTILAAAEAKIMTLANIFPMQTDSVASLRCMRVNFKTDEYVVGMGFGGIEWRTYAMDDAEFASYVSSQGGVLNYK